MSSLVLTLVAAGIVLASAIQAAQAVVVVNPSSLTDTQFNFLKGIASGCSEVTIQENWTVEGDGRAMPNAFTRINEWTSNSTFAPRVQQNQLWP